MFTIWNIEKKKDREKEKVGRQGEDQREKELERETKNKRRHFCWRNNMKFCSGGMLAATRMKMSDSGKKNK